MIQPRSQRRLAAILVADVVGYSRLMGEDEEGTRVRFNDLLAPVHDWFTEGFDTADLMEAKALLGNLRG